MTSATHPSRLDVAIIGAGFYGLNAARTYLRLEPKSNILIFDQERTVGGTWAQDRIYPNLVAQVEHGYFNYPSMPMPRDGTTDHNLVSGDMIFKYLDKFADDNDLKQYLRFRSTVQTVQRHEKGGWDLVVDGQTIHASKIIVATGVTSIENKVPFDVAKDAIPMIHCKRIAQNIKSMVSNNVQHFVIVGAAKSAYDAAYFLCSQGKQVTWIIRPNGGGPMPIMPPEVLGMNTITMGSTRLMNYLSPSLLTPDNWVGAFFHRTALGRWLTRAHWKYISGQANKAAGFGGDAGVVEGLKPDIGDAPCFWCDSSVGLITMSDFWSTLKTGNINIIRDNVDLVDSKGVKLRSVQHIDADFVINCTGWGDHFAFFSAEMKDELGIAQYDQKLSPDTQEKAVDFWELYDKKADAVVDKTLPLLGQGPKDLRAQNGDRILTQRRWRLYNRVIPLANVRRNDRSIVVLGQIHTTQTPTIAEIQSLWAVAYLLGEIRLPSEPDMIREIAEWNAWTRKRYLGVGEKYPYALFDWISYLDRLLRDLKIEHQRKNNLLADFFTPYGPHCYEGILDEYITKRKAGNIAKRDGSSSGFEEKLEQ